MRIVLHTMELRWICQVLLLLSASWTTVNSLECYGCEGDAECDQSPIRCSGPDAYCQTSVLEASVFFLTALNIKKTCAYGERPDKVTQITVKRKVSLSLQENYCNTNFCNNETDFEPAPAEPNNLHCYGALCQGRQCASSTAMDNLICLGNQTKCVELAISGKMGITSDVSMKGCAEIPECEEEMGFRSTHASFHMQCCDSDFCNGGTGPTEDDLVPNGVECYSCSEGDEKIGCPLERATTVNCTGSMTSCLEAFGVTRESDVVSSRVIRGCAAPKTCNGSFLSLLHQFQEPQVFCCSGNLCNSRTFVGVQNTSHGVSNKPSSDGHSEHSSHVTYNADIFSAADTANGSVVGTTRMEGKSNLTLSGNENILNSQSNMSIANYYEDSTADMDSGTNSDLTQLEYQQDSGYDPQGQTDIQITDDFILSHLGMPLDDLNLNVSVSNMSSDLYQSGVDEGGYSTGGSASVFQSLKPSESNNSIFSNSSTGFLSGPPDIAISSDNGSASISGVSPGNKNNSVSDSSSVYHTGVNDTVLSSNDYNSAPNSGMALGGSNDLNSKNLSTVSPIASSTASPVNSAFSNTVSGSLKSDVSEILTGGTNGSASFNSSMDYHNSSDHIGLSGSTSPSVIPPGVTNNSMSPSSTALYSGSDHTDVPTGNSSMYSTSSDMHDVTTHTPILSAGDSSSAPLAGIYSGTHDVSLSSSISTVYHNVTKHTTSSPGNHSTASFSAMSEDSHNVSGSKSYAVFYNNGSSPRDHGTDTHSSTYHSGNKAEGNLLDSNNSTTITPMSSSFSTMLSGNQTGLSAISSGVSDGSGVINSSMVHYNTSNHTRHDSAASHALMPSGDPNDLIFNTSATHYYSGTDINIGNDSIASSSLSNLSATSYGEPDQTTSPSFNHLIDITVPETILSYPHSSHGGFASTSPPTSSEISTSHLGMSAGGTNDSTYNISSSDYNYSVSVMPPGGHNDVISNTSSAIYHSDSEHAGLTYGDFKNDSLSGMPSVGHNDYLPNVSSIIYHSGSEHEGLSTGEHSNGSLTGMPSVGHNDTISNTSSTMYHSDSEHAYGDFKNDSVSGMPSRGHNDLLSNTSSPIYPSGSEHTGLYTVDHSNGSLPEVPPGAGNDSVSDVIAATGVSTGARSNDSLSVTPPGSYNDSLSDIYSAIYHSEPEDTDLPSCDYKNDSVSGMPSEGQNASLSNISSNIGASSVDYNKESLSGMPPEGHNDSFSNDSSAIYHSDSEHTGLSTVDHNNSSALDIPPGGHNEPPSNISSTLSHSGSGHTYGSLSGMPPGGQNGSISNASTDSYHSDSEHNGVLTSDPSNGSLSGMTSVGHNASDSNTSPIIYHSGSEHAGVTAVDYKNDSLSGMPTDRHNNSHFNISSDLEHIGLHSGDYKNDSFSGITSEDHNYLLSNMSSNSGLSSADYNSDPLSTMLSEGLNESLSNMSSNSGLSPGGYNSDSFLGMPPGGHNDSLSNISSTMYYTGSEHNGLSTVHNNNDSLSGAPSEGHNDSLTNASSNIYHSGSELNGISNTDHSNGSLSGISLGGHNNSASNSSTLYHSSSEYYNFSISGLGSALHTGAFPRNSSSNSSFPVSHGNPNNTNMTSGHSSGFHSEITSTSSNGSPLGYHTGANHTGIFPGGNESSGSNMSASSLVASSDSFLNRNTSTMNTNEPHHESSSGIPSTGDPGNISMHNVSDETVSSSFFDSAVNSDIHYRGDPNGTSGLTLAPTTTMEGETGNNINTTSSHPARTINTYVFLVVVIWGLMY